MTNTKTMTRTNTFREQLQRPILMTCDLVTFDQNNEGTLQDQKQTMPKANTMTKTNTFTEHLQKAIPETCDL